MINVAKSQVIEVGKGVTVEEILFNNNAPFKASFFNIKPGNMSPVDSHSVKEAWIIINGLGELYYDNEIIIVQKGDVILFDSYKEHAVKNILDTELNIVSIWWN